MKFAIGFSFFIIILFLEAYLIRFPIKDWGTLNLLDLFLLTSSGFYLLVIIRKKLTKKLVNFIFNKNRLIFIFLIALIGSFLFNAYKNNFALDVTNSLGALKSFYLLPIIFAILTIFLMKQKLINKNNFLIAYFILSFVISLISLGYFFSQALTYDLRLEAFYNSPNYLSMILAPSILISSFILLSLDKFQNLNTSKIKIFLFFNLIVQFFILLQTKSLAALLAVFISVLIVILKNFTRLKNLFSKSLYSIVILNLIYILLIFFLPNILNGFNYDPFFNRSSSDSRLVINLASRKMLLNTDNYLLGIGAGNFQEVYLDYQKYFLPYPEWAVPHPHHLTLNVWLEAGILGFICLILILFQISDKFKRLDFSNNQSRLIFALLLIYFLIHGFFDVTFWKNDLAVIFWFVLIFNLNLGFDPTLKLKPQSPAAEKSAMAKK
jgi:hypothetical protein